MRKLRTGFVPVRNLSRLNGVAAALLIAAAPFAVPASAAQAQPAAAVAATGVGAGSAVSDFYARRAGQPLWLQSGQPNEAAQNLLRLLDSAAVDGLDPRKYNRAAIAKALRSSWGGNPKAARKAEELLSNAYVAYARDLRAAPPAGMQFFDPTLKPAPPPARTLLDMAARAPSLERFVAEMGWMNPAYAQLRAALASGYYSDGDRLRLNLARARVLPSRTDRYVVVNAAAQRLDMYEGGRVVDSMRVVVGKQKDKSRTPMIASSLQVANLNPYWNVPPDLAAERIAPFVVKDGLNYLRRHRYEVLSDWSDNATPIDPASVDWQAVADGKTEVRVRQLPGTGNSLGKVKFNFPTPYGVYLHDTPDKQLLTEETRLFSGGCIRLEDAARFGTWLFGKPLHATSKEPELPVKLERPVPVYVTYLTAEPSGSTITFFDDVYGWDAQRLAEMRRGGSGAGFHF